MERPHWDYYLTIVEDLGKTGRFVEFSEANFSAIKFVRVILSVGSEIDVVAKLLCAKIKPKEKPQNIDEYGEIIVAKHSRISTIKIAHQSTALPLLLGKTGAVVGIHAGGKSITK